MNPGPQAIAMLKHFESCRLHAYLDSGHVPTIGWGATGSDVHMGLVWTQEQADARLVLDLHRFAGYTTSQLGGAPTTPAQFGALNDVCYNAGPGNLAKSPMLAAHRAGDTADAAKAWRDWHIHDHAGNVEPGLILRREAEAQLYLAGVAV